MKARNTLSLFGYVRNFILWQSACTMLYRAVLFRPLEGLTYSESWNLFFGIQMIFMFIAIFVNVEKGRNMTGVIVCSMLPVEIYAFISYFSFYKIICTSALALIGVTMSIYAVLMFDRKIKNREWRVEIIFARVRKYINCSAMFCFIVFSLVLFPLMYRAVAGYPLKTAKVEAVAATKENTYTIKNNIETVCKLKESVWKNLSVDEKLDVLQTVANIEANYLGLSTKLKVSTTVMKENVLGWYRDDEQRIGISVEVLENGTAHKCLEVLCHEAYHGYEKRLTDLYETLDEKSKKLFLFKDAEKYSREFANYTMGEGYYVQMVEADSREYAQDAVKDYYKRIDEYLKEE